MSPATGSGLPDSLSPVIWSKLSLELLAIIIDQTADTETLDSWCTATQGNRYLHETALAARWKTATIDDRDLLPAPGWDTANLKETQERLERNGLGRHWKPLGDMVNKLLDTSDQSGRCPADYVQDLVFDFRMFRYYEEDVQDFCEILEEDSDFEYPEDYSPSTVGPQDLIPTVYSLGYTVRKLLKGRFPNLRHISCLGDTPEFILEFVASQDATKIRSLTIRSPGGYSGFYIRYKHKPDYREYPLRRWPLPFSDLLGLRQLKVLKIYQLSKPETTSFLNSLRTLSELRHLTLACEEEEHQWEKDDCAFKSLFHQIFQARETPNDDSALEVNCSGPFPPKLESLSLIDTGYRSDKVTMPSGQPTALGSSLAHLCVDTGNVIWIPTLLDCFSNSELRSLYIPGLSHDDSTPNNGYHAHIEHAIAKSKRSLNKIRILRAWRTDRPWIDELNHKYQGTYTVQELVLGTRNESWYFRTLDSWHKSIPKPTLSHYLHGFEHSTEGEMGRWGSEIKRIRIDHIELVGLDVSVISEPFYRNLRILMLQPAYRGMRIDNLPGFDAIDEAVCAELAKSIASAAPSLRIIVVASYWYWVPTDGPGKRRSSSLWTWADAKLDPIQGKLMSSALSKADLAFLEPSSIVPYWHERDMIEWHRNLPHLKLSWPHKPSTEMYDQWNYVTMFPSSEKDMAF